MCGLPTRHVPPAAANPPGTAPPIPQALFACSMLAMNVWGEVQRGVSTTNTTAVGSMVAKASVMMAPDADHVKISIWPGVSTSTYSSGGSRGLQHRSMTCAGQWVGGRGGLRAGGLARGEPDAGWQWCPQPGSAGAHVPGQNGWQTGSRRSGWRHWVPDCTPSSRSCSGSARIGQNRGGWVGRVWGAAQGVSDRVLTAVLGSLRRRAVPRAMQALRPSPAPPCRGCLCLGCMAVWPRQDPSSPRSRSASWKRRGLPDAA